MNLSKTLLGRTVITGLGIILISSALQAGKREALVLVNGNYAHGAKLANPAADGELLKTALTKAGFTVTLAQDQSLEGMRAKVSAFQIQAAGAEAAAVYYAGHGMEKDGQNYLVPVDAVIKEEYQIPTRTLPLSELMGALDESKVPLKLLFMDCCRDNPLGRSFRRSGRAGLAALSETPEGCIIAYATSPGKTALDGVGANSPFADALATALAKPGLTVEDVIKDAIGGVKKSTNKEQTPWWSGNYEGKFVFLPGDMARPIVPLVPEAGGAPFTNSLGMKFVAVPGTKVQMCIHETRRMDYAAYAAAKSGVDEEWKAPELRGVKFPTEGEHPVVSVSWEDAKGFCEWLSRKEGKTYRLPRDREWSVAVGIGSQESATATPKDLSGKIEDVYPWGGSFTGSSINGNYCGQELKGKFSGMIDGYRDGYEMTAPVMQFRANKLGIYDLGGNVWEWCEDWYDTDEKWRVLRGGSWRNDTSMYCSSASRGVGHPSTRDTNNGFRVVLVVAGGG